MVCHWVRVPVKKNPPVGDQRAIRHGDVVNDLRFGIVVGTLAGLGIASSVAAGLVLTKFDFDKSTPMFVGLLTVAAAVATIIVLTFQIRQTGQLENERRKRRLRAAQATLPLALARITEYAQASVDHLKLFYREEGPVNSMAIIGKRPPDLPQHDLAVLTNCIELDEGKAPDALFRLLCALQVQRSRIWRISRREYPAIGDFVVDTLELQARCGMLFEYARNEGEAPVNEPNAKQMMLAATVNEIRGDRYGKILATIARRYDPDQPQIESDDPRLTSSDTLSDKA